MSQFCVEEVVVSMAGFVLAEVISIRLFAFRDIPGLLSTWNLCSMIFGRDIDRWFLGLVRCRTRRYYVDFTLV